MPRLVRCAVVGGEPVDKAQCNICKKLYGSVEEAEACERRDIRRACRDGEGGTGMRRGAARGGMQSARAQYSIYCPKCGKPAARVTERGKEKEYLHFTKKGSVIHVVREEGLGCK